MAAVSVDDSVATVLSVEVEVRPSGRVPDIASPPASGTSAPGCLDAWPRAKLLGYIGLLGGFTAVEVSKGVLSWMALHGKPTEIVQAFVAMQGIVSLLSALVVSAAMRGCQGFKTALCPSSILRCIPIGIGFSLSQSALIFAYQNGAGPAMVQVLGLSYMPLSAVLSHVFFRRRYGWLEIHALAFLTLGVMMFSELRDRADGIPDGRVVIGWNMLSVVLACCASLYAERVVKTKYCPEDLAQPYPVQKAWFEAGGLLVAAFGLLVIWFFGLNTDVHPKPPPPPAPQSAPVSQGFFLGGGPIKPPCPNESPQDWWAHQLAGWDFTMFAALTARVLQAWMAGALAKHLSTVAKAVIQSGTVLIIVFSVECIRSKIENFDMQSSMLAVIVTLSTFLYQMGRRTTTSTYEDPPSPRPAENGDAFGVANSFAVRYLPDEQELSASYLRGEHIMAPADYRQPPRISSRRHLVAAARYARAQARVHNQRMSDMFATAAGYTSQLGFVALFILSDATRTLVYGWAINGTPIVQQSIVMTVSAISIPIGSLMSLWLQGRRGLLAASCDPWSALRCLPAAACFSAGQTLQIKSYGLGINPAVNTVLGYFYMPLCAVLSRCFFGRKYSPLEWLALVQLSASAVLFVLLRNARSDGTTAVSAVICCLSSVVLSCLGSLGTERIMKAQGSPFYMQKVHLEYGGLLTAFCGLFLVGLVSSADADAFWKPRDVGGEMRTGIFVGWSFKTVVAVVATLLQSWLGGVVSKRLSTVVRSVAQCLSLLIVYFFGDLVLRALPFDWVMGVAAVVVALSVQVFAVAGIRDRPQSEEGDTSQPLDDSLISST